MKTLYTVGTSNRTPEEFVLLLHRYGIQLLVDVRRFPTSRIEHFKREHLAPLCTAAGIDYQWMGDALGAFRSKGYDHHMGSDDFKKALHTLEGLALSRTAALCCAEKLPWKCHRLFIARELEKHTWNVLHIIDPDTIWTPQQQELF